MIKESSNKKFDQKHVPQKDSLKAKTLGQFNTISHAKVFSSLMLVGNKRSYVLTQKRSFLSTCKLLLLNIKKLIFYNVLTECTSLKTN